MEFNKNRLRFVHCEHLFENAQQIKDYVRSIQGENPALYAEPQIFKYGDEREPNLILAIGSVGDGEFKFDTKANEIVNRTFFIDFSQVEKDITLIFEELKGNDEELLNLKEVVDNLIASCGVDEKGVYSPDLSDKILKNAESLKMADKLLSDHISALEKKTTLIPEETKTVKMTVEETEDGTSLKSDVKLGSKVVNYKLLKNILLDEHDGLFANVDLAYNDDESKLILLHNGETEKEIVLPKPANVIGGKYDKVSESLILKLSSKVMIDDVLTDKVSIDLGALINEWTVEGENSRTPIILKKTPKKSTQTEHGEYETQDVLSADVRLLDGESTKVNNILKKDSSKRYLYVDGSAENIKYKNETVADALDKSVTKDTVSSEKENVLTFRHDKLFAEIGLDFDSVNNELIFTRTSPSGDDVRKVLRMNTVNMIKEIKYDDKEGDVIIVYVNGESRIKADWLIEKLVADNADATVTISIDNKEPGKDTIKANVNVSKHADNIIEVIDHDLFVNGNASKIKYNKKGETVEDTLDRLLDTEDRKGSIKNELMAKADKFTLVDTKSVVLDINDEHELRANVSLDNSSKNIIRETENGLVANVTLYYDQAKKEFTFDNGLEKTVINLDKAIVGLEGSGEDRTSPVNILIESTSMPNIKKIKATLDISKDDDNLLVEDNGTLFASSNLDDHYGYYGGESKLTAQGIVNLIYRDINKINSIVENLDLSGINSLNVKIDNLDRRVTQNEIDIEELKKNGGGGGGGTGTTVDLVGYQYIGVATTSTIPMKTNQKICYLATEIGKYDKFGKDIELTFGESAMLKYNVKEAKWEKEKLGLVTLDGYNKLYDKLFPLTTAFSCSPSIVDKRATPSTNVSLKWSASVEGKAVKVEEYNPHVITYDSKTITLVTGKETVPVSSISKNTTFTFKLGSKTMTSSISFVEPKFCGVVNPEFEINEQNVKGLAKATLSGNRNHKASGINMAKQKLCYAYPQEYGKLVNVIDGNGYDILESFEINDRTTINGVKYYVYIMKNTLTINGGEYNFK